MLGSCSCHFKTSYLNILQVHYTRKYWIFKATAEFEKWGLLLNAMNCYFWVFSSGLVHSIFPHSVASQDRATKRCKEVPILTRLFLRNFLWANRNETKDEDVVTSNHYLSISVKHQQCGKRSQKFERSAKGPLSLASLCKWKYQKVLHILQQKWCRIVK